MSCVSSAESFGCAVGERWPWFDDLGYWRWRERCQHDSGMSFFLVPLFRRRLTWVCKAADVGVGISGEEGLQAVNSSDYAIAQVSSTS